jgi:activator of HSP90 ATPase
MSSVTKPIMLNETGEQIVQKLTEVAESNKAYEKLLDTKADKVDVSAPFNFKGDTTYASLPTSGNEINDTYYCSDKKCRYTWNGKGWYQSSMDEVDYTDELAKMESDLEAGISQLSSEIANITENNCKFFVKSNNLVRNMIFNKSLNTNTGNEADSSV